MTSADIENCKTAKLYDIGHIQGYGALAAIDSSTGLVVTCSENFAAVTGIASDQLLGRHWSEFIDAADMKLLADLGRQARRRFWQLKLRGTDYSITGHSDGPITIVEIEPANSLTSYDSNSRIGYLEELAALTDPESVAQLLMRHIADISGFDRVMLYRFMPDWHGKVIAEQLRPGIAGFLNQHFPASDIPENARALYTINLQRYIADTDQPTAKLISEEADRTLNLTWSMLRAVHPVHIQYMKNIGACSSFSVSIVVFGKLWGLVACHNLEVRALDFGVRLLAEELARMAALQISGLTALNLEKARSVLRLELARIEQLVRTAETPVQPLTDSLDALMSVFKGDSVLLSMYGRNWAKGAVNDGDTLPTLRRWLAGHAGTACWHTSKISGSLQQFPDLLKCASGMLYIPLGCGNYLVVLRSEHIQNVTWAGREQHPAQQAENLSPRASFEGWVEQTRGMAPEWDETEIEAALQFSHNLSIFYENQALEKLAMEDSLTGLPNRRQFEQVLAGMLLAGQRRKSRLAIMMLDLDKFKDVNDTWGHAAGDELLSLVASRLALLLRERDIVARLGGDEFALIQQDIRGPADAERVAARIVEELRRPFVLRDATVEVGASVGIALYPEHGEDGEDLMEKADDALYEIKRAGRNAWRFWQVKA